MERRTEIVQCVCLQVQETPVMRYVIARFIVGFLAGFPVIV